LGKVAQNLASLWLTHVLFLGLFGFCSFRGIASYTCIVQCPIGTLSQAQLHVPLQGGAHMATLG